MGHFTPRPALSSHCAPSEPVSSSRIFQQRHYGGRQLVLSGQLCPFISLPGTAVIKRNEETGSNSEARNHSSVSFTSFSAASLLPDSVSVTSPPPSLFTSISSLLSLSLSLSLYLYTLLLSLTNAPLARLSGDNRARGICGKFTAEEAECVSVCSGGSRGTRREISKGKSPEKKEGFEEDSRIFT